MLWGYVMSSTITYTASPKFLLILSMTNIHNGITGGCWDVAIMIHPINLALKHNPPAICTCRLLQHEAKSSPSNCASINTAFITQGVI